jgi:hypothetical protein
VSDVRCGLTDLLARDCDHCQSRNTRPAAPATEGPLAGIRFDFGRTRGVDDHGSRPFPAGYPGRCDECGDGIEEGDPIRMRDGAAVHDECA